MGGLNMENKLLSLCTGLNSDAMQEQIGSFPLEGFPTRMQKLVLDIVRQENYPLDFTVVAMLSAAASAIGNSYQINIKGQWLTSPILYMMIVGNPGIGKTPPLDFAYAPMRKEDTRRYALFIEQMKEYERRKGNKNETEELEKPILSRSIISDFTPEAMIRAHDSNLRGITIFVDEIMGMFQSVNRYSNGQLIEQLLTAYSGKPLNVSRCGQPLPFHIHQPCINIIGTTQTYRIKELLDMGFVENGMMDRFLFAYSPNRKIDHWKRDVFISEEPGKIWSDIITKLMDLTCCIDNINHMVNSEIISMNDVASDMFYSWRNDLVDQINSIEDEKKKDTRFAKDPLNLARIALVIQLLRWAFDEAEKTFIDEKSVETAIQVINYFTNCYHQLMKIMKEDNLDSIEKAWFDELPNSFTTAQAVEGGEQVGMAHRTVNRNLTRFVDNGFLKKIKQGQYEKV